jgi:hypothetical protein
VDNAVDFPADEVDIPRLFFTVVNQQFFHVQQKPFSFGCLG